MTASTAERILDAAGRCFAEQGVARTSVGDVARAAGCSRPTVYRWFDDGAALRTAFVHREARRLGADIAAGVTDLHDPGERLVTAVLAALRGVRADPTLAAWFSGGAAGDTADLAASSAVLESLVAAFLGAADGGRDVARWVLRVVVSLLTVPEAGEDEERALLERFLVPVVVGSRHPA